MRFERFFDSAAPSLGRVAGRSNSSPCRTCHLQPVAIQCCQQGENLTQRPSRRQASAAGQQQRQRQQLCCRLLALGTCSGAAAAARAAAVCGRRSRRRSQQQQHRPARCPDCRPAFNIIMIIILRVPVTVGRLLAAHTSHRPICSSQLRSPIKPGAVSRASFVYARYTISFTHLTPPNLQQPVTRRAGLCALLSSRPTNDACEFTAPGGNFGGWVAAFRKQLVAAGNSSSTI